ncbi:MAG: 16S rRNA (cytosine(1402)-N(4))-methyltransferase RsmH [Alphaproteobacteria bacterium]|nr:16S rRNA (cytosine(1402)-N(4))-methyltransferase RsmH [Alphaproteobacteria bacterium]
MNENYQKHYPVMLNEVLQALAPKDGEIYVDATFGNGGYSEAILKAANCRVIALDRDNTVKLRADELKQKFGARFDFRQGCFGDFDELVEENIDGAVFDIGVSSMQLDEGKRGFSFTKDAPLDMRMSQSGLTAADLVNNLSEQELADILYQYGEEKKSRQIAHKIVEARKIKPITTTIELADIIYAVLGRGNHQSINPATRSFQALRIKVNDELGELEKGLAKATSCLNPKGRLVVVDFHSLEDRIVKTFFKTNSEKRVHTSRYKLGETTSTDATFAFASKAILPSENELAENARSRSAKLRYAIKH